ncbi:polypyrimidine tract-binding protein 1 [Aphelenchoides avenae]|nr:polypyrimidine tract-binding protein 1 [Aphelenchus avenae]
MLIDTPTRQSSNVGMTAIARSNPSPGSDLHSVLRRLGNGVKRGPEELLSQAYAHGNGFLAAAMTADSEAKKAKLDLTVPSAGLSAASCFPSSALFSVPAVTALQLQQQQQALMAAAAIASASAPSAPTTVPTNGLFNVMNGVPLVPSSQPSQHSNASTSASTGSDAQTISRVIHLRNIPSDMTELELIHFCLPFGQLSNYLMLKGKNQAFVEYEDEACAQSLVTVANAVPMAIRGRTIFCQYSTHQELKVERKGATKNGFIIGDTSAASNLLVLGNANGSNAGSTGAPSSTGGGSNSTSMLDVTSSTQQQPNAVLRVIIDNMIYPVTLDVLYAIFTRYGKVLRIITFNKNNTFQALVQLSEANAAQTARHSLDGQNVYNGCCTLRIDYSKLSTLNVKYNNDKSRDYTNPNLPSGELTFEQQLSLVTAAAQGQLPGSLSTLMPSAFNFPLTAGTNTTYLQQQAFQTADGLSAANGQSNLLLTTLGSQLANGTNTAAGNALTTALQFNQLGLLNLSPVVLVSNLNEAKVTPDALFTLFGVYGDVQRVKILFNKKDNALVQYSEAQQAQLAIQHLDKVRWHDKVIRVTTSKHTNVQMPKEGQPDAGLTRDYTNSSLHRFKKPGSKNYMNIYPPSSTLHLSNIPPSTTEEFLMSSFEEKGFSVKEFKFFQRDHKMALMQLEDVETAINALIEMHNFKLADNAHLRVSFSKKGLKV